MVWFLLVINLKRGRAIRMEQIQQKPGTTRVTSTFSLEMVHTYPPLMGCVCNKYEKTHSKRHGPWRRHNKQFTQPAWPWCLTLNLLTKLTHLWVIFEPNVKRIHPEGKDPCDLELCLFDLEIKTLKLGGTAYIPMCCTFANYEGDLSNGYEDQERIHKFWMAFVTLACSILCWKCIH